MRPGRRRLTGDGGPADAAHAHAGAVVGAHGALLLLSPSSMTRVPLADVMAAATQPAWSPDGRRIALVSDGAIAVLDVAAHGLPTG